MVPKKPDENPKSMEQSIAFGIAGSVVTGDKRQKHVALIYRAHNSRIMLLHLGWHHFLRHHEWDAQYYWLELTGLDQELQETFADWAVLVAGAAPGNPIRYSVVFNPDSNFDADGRFIDRKDGSGLTCATFLLALFNDYSIPLIDVREWPASRPGDFSWTRRILKLLRKYVTSWEWLEQVKRRHLLQRFRPEEVFASAGLYQGVPLKFADVEGDGRTLLQFLPR